MSPKGPRITTPAREELVAPERTQAGEDVAEREVPPSGAPGEPTSPPEEVISPRPETRVNLQDLPEYRQVQAAYDRQIAAERKARQAAEARLQLLEQQSQAQQAQELRQQLGAVDPEQARIMQQMSALEARRYAQQLREWEAYKVGRIKEEGLDPQDERFQRDYQGVEGSLQFQNDLAEASKERLKRELEESRRAASPEQIAKLVEAQVAKVLAAKGFDSTDLGGPSGPTTPGDEDEWRRDAAKVQRGAMTSAQYLKKWGDRDLTA